MQNEIEHLKKGLDLSITKKIQRDQKGHTSSIAYSKSGKHYTAGSIASDTHLLDISSEQAVLAIAVHNNDFLIEKVITLNNNPDTRALISPLVLKLLIDFHARTGEKIDYTVVNSSGEILVEIKDVATTMVHYKPAPSILKKTERSSPSPNFITVDKMEPLKFLKQYAVEGVARNFPTYDSASSYGASVISKDGTLYFGGQYSSFERRTGLHAEMAVVTSALMNGKRNITHIGLVSSKFVDAPCELCGCCRQFLSELAQKFSWNLEIITFAKDTDEYKTYTIDELLPNSWSSKKW